MECLKVSQDAASAAALSLVKGDEILKEADDSQAVEKEGVLFLLYGHWPPSHCAPGQWKSRNRLQQNTHDYQRGSQTLSQLLPGCSSDEDAPPDYEHDDMARSVTQDCDWTMNLGPQFSINYSSSKKRKAFWDTTGAGNIGQEKGAASFR